MHFRDIFNHFVNVDVFWVWDFLVANADQVQHFLHQLLDVVIFFGPFYSDYRVMMLSGDYKYALVGSGSSKYLWILSRTPSLPGEIIDRILQEASDRGYDTGKLIWVDQSVDSISGQGM